MWPSVVSFTTTSVSNIAAVKSVSGTGCSPPVRWLGFKNRKASLNVERTIYDFVDTPVCFALGLLVSHSEHLRLPTMTVQRHTLGGPPRTTEYATPRYFILTERWGVKAVPPPTLADCLGHLLTL
jgi:hypothetical protein